MENRINTNDSDHLCVLADMRDLMSRHLSFRETDADELATILASSEVEIEAALQALVAEGELLP